MLIFHENVLLMFDFFSHIKKNISILQSFLYSHILILKKKIEGEQGHYTDEQFGAEVGIYICFVVLT